MANTSILTSLITIGIFIVVSTSVVTLESCPDHCYCFIVSEHDAPPTALLSNYMEANDWLEGSKAMACWGRSRVPRPLPTDIKYLILIGNDKPKRRRRVTQTSARIRNQRMQSPRTLWSQYTQPQMSIVRKNIRTVPPEAFSGLRDIIQLDLHGNKIMQLAPTTFAGMPHLVDLDLNNNRLKSLEPNLLKDATALRKFRVAGNFLRSLPEDVFGATEMIEYLDLSDNLLAHIPDSCFQTLTELTHLNLSYNRVSERSEMMLAGLGRLTELLLQNNKLGRITTLFLLSNSQLRTIDLSHNRIRMIEDNAFQNQNQLERLDLSGNDLVTLESAGFRGASSLITLDLSYNHIKEIKGNAFTGLTALTTIDMRGNNVSRISKETFAGMPSLTSLTLAENNISDLAPESMENLHQLEFLDLSKNRIHHVRARSFHGLTDLMELNLAENNIYIMEPEAVKTTTLSFMSKLTWLNLQDNRLIELQEDVFLGAPSLRVLTISRNRISRISARAFSGFSRLHRLVLSENNLEALAGGSFRSLRTLEMLDLSNNSIREISSSAFKGLEELSTINLANNALTNDNMGWLGPLRSVQTINLNANQLTIFSSGDFEVATNLRYLYISQNHLSSLSVTTDSRLYLYHLDISNNALSTMEEFHPHILPGRALDIAGNPWHCDCRLVTLLSDMMRTYGIRLDRESNSRCRSPTSLHGAQVAELVKSGVQCIGTELDSSGVTWSTPTQQSLTQQWTDITPTATKSTRRWSWVAVIWDSATDMPVCNGALVFQNFVVTSYQCLQRIANTEGYLQDCLGEQCWVGGRTAPSSMEVKVSQGKHTMSDFRTMAETYRVSSIYKMSQHTASDDSSVILLKLATPIDMEGSTFIEFDKSDDYGQRSDGVEGKRVLASGWWIDRSSAPAVVGRQKRRHYTLLSSLCPSQNDVHREFLCGRLEQPMERHQDWDCLGSPVTVRDGNEWRLLGILVKREGSVAYIKDLRQDVPAMSHVINDADRSNS